MDSRLRMVIIGLRLCAVIVMIVSVLVLWRVMKNLSWQVDCLIAATASVAFAYWFERDRMLKGRVVHREAKRLDEPMRSFTDA
jgi:hypothetical protein